MSSTVVLNAIEIAVYILLIPLIVFLVIRHGLTHSLSFIYYSTYLCIFSVLRIVAYILGISIEPGHHESEDYSCCQCNSFRWPVSAVAFPYRFSASR
jgi:hypothetical protein